MLTITSDLENNLANNLASLFPFSGLLPASIDQLRSSIEQIEKPQGEIVIDTANDLSPEHLQYLLDGEVRIYYADGQSARIKSGSQRALLPITMAAPKHYRVDVVSNHATLLRLPYGEFEQMALWDQLARLIDAIRQFETDSDAADGAVMASHPCWLGLNQLSAFKALKPGMIFGLLDSFEQQPCEQGQVLAQANASASALYLLDQSMASVSVMRDEGPHLLSYLQHGDYFGEQALDADDQSVYPMYFRVVRAGRIWRLARDRFLALENVDAVSAMGFAKAAAKIKQGAVLLDVRTPHEFAQRAIDGAINMPLSTLAIDAHTKLSIDHEVIVYCNSHLRAEAAAHVLQRLGHVAYVLDGGLNAVLRGLADRTMPLPHSSKH